MNGDIPTQFQTDLEIKTETKELLQECIDWSMATFGEYKNPDEEEKDGWKLPKNYFSSQDITAMGLSLWKYLQLKILNHSPKYYRQKEFHQKNIGGTPIIRKDE